jgi:Helix-turn-helix.
MNPSIEQFTKNLKLLRKARGLTQTQLGEKLGLTKQSIINYEKGLTFPTGKRLNDLITALDVTPEQLLTAEFIQLPEEKKLLQLCYEKSTFLAQYELFQDQSIDDEIEETELRKRISMLLKNASNTELYQTILAIYDNQINTAKDRYVSQMSDNMLNGNDPDAEYPDIDLTKVTNQ